MACTAMGMSAQPEIMMVGILLPWPQRIRCKPSPPIPAIRTSSTRHFGSLGISWQLSRNASAERYVRAFKPVLRTIRLSDSHTCGSSSTIYTVALPLDMSLPSRDLMNSKCLLTVRSGGIMPG